MDSKSLVRLWIEEAGAIDTPSTRGRHDRYGRSGSVVSILAIVLSIVTLGPSANASAVISPQAAANQSETHLELRLAERQSGPGLMPRRLADSSVVVYVAETALITNRDVIDARVVERDGTFSIAIDFTSAAGTGLRHATKDRVGKPLAIVVNGQVVSAPELSEAVSDAILIQGGFTRKEAEDLGAELKALGDRNRAQGSILCRILKWC